MLSRTRPDWVEASERAWDAWCRAAGSRLPRSNVPQVAIAAYIHCVEDIPLHSGLLDLLSRDDIQPVVLLALPDPAGVAIAQARGLRAGWASLVSLMTDAELDKAIGRLPPDMPLALFRWPAPMPRSAKGRIGAAARSGTLSADWSAAAHGQYGVFLGRSGSYVSPERWAPTWVDEDHILSLYHALEATGALAPPQPTESPQSAVAQERHVGRNDRDATLWIRPSEIELSSTGRDELLAVVVSTDGAADHVTAVQPVSLNPLPGRLSIPLLPRHASEVERGMTLHRIGSGRDQASQEIRLATPPANIEPWMLSAYLNRGGGGNSVIRAFAEGTGCRIDYAEDEPEILRDVPVVWGVLRGSDQILARARAQKLHFFYIDHAYFDRGHGNSYRITLNRYEAGKVRKVENDRLKRLDVEVQPWRKTGRSIIVCPPTDFFAAAHGCTNWLETTLATLRLESDRPIIVREKPKPGESSQPLPDALRDAHALVTHSSNVAIEAACLGTPVFVSPTSAAAPIGQTDISLIEQPRYPKRNGWLNHLAYSQFSLTEIRDGTAWKLLKSLEDREFV